MATAEMRSNAAPGAWGGRRGVGQGGPYVVDASPSHLRGRSLRAASPALGTTHVSRASGQAVAGGCWQQSFGVCGDGGSSTRSSGCAGRGARGDARDPRAREPGPGHGGARLSTEVGASLRGNPTRRFT